nr:heme attachment to plastid cytochrome c [Cylindrocapsa geminella]
MNFVVYETFFNNLSFFLLFLSMISYWIQLSFFLFLKNINIGKITLILANISLFCLLFIRWKDSGHVPVSNLYESLIFLCWSLTSLQILVEVFIKTKLLAGILIPSIVLIHAFTTFSLPKDMQEASSLVPALQSNWLLMHVTVMILSYASLLLGSLLSIAFLFLTEGKNLVQNFYNIYFEKEKKNQPMSECSQDVTNFESFSILLDNLSYRLLGIGFPFLTIGIFSGAVWANEAWGSYWSWDPKETWALITWMMFAIYLHTRLTKGWNGKKPALIASLGFFTVWMCFLGVNLLGEGLHSYGWFQYSKEL